MIGRFPRHKYPRGLTRLGSEGELRASDEVVALGSTAVAKVNVKETCMVPGAHLHVGPQSPARLDAADRYELYVATSINLAPLASFDHSRVIRWLERFKGRAA